MHICLSRWIFGAHIGRESIAEIMCVVLGALEIREE